MSIISPSVVTFPGKLFNQCSDGAKHQNRKRPILANSHPLHTTRNYRMFQEKIPKVTLLLRTYIGSVLLLSKEIDFNRSIITILKGRTARSLASITFLYLHKLSVQKKRDFMALLSTHMDIYVHVYLPDQYCRGIDEVASRYLPAPPPQLR